MLGKINNITDFIEQLGSKEPKLTLSSIRILLNIMQKGQTTFDAIEAELKNIPRSTISRNLSELTGSNWKSEKGLGLVEFYFGSEDPRRKLIRLSAKGRALLARFN